MKIDNTLPSGIHDLMQLGEHMAGGLKSHGHFLKMAQTPEGEFRALLARLRAAETRLSEARVALGAAGKASTAEDRALTRFLARAKLAFCIVFGRKWSERWLAAGFIHRRTSVPKPMRPRMALARSVACYLVRNPGDAYPRCGVTAREAGAAHRRLWQAQCKLRDARALFAAKKQARDETERALREKMRQVVVILGVTIRPENPRWLDFGLVQPKPRAAASTRHELASPIAPLPEIESITPPPAVSPPTPDKAIAA